MSARQEAGATERVLQGAVEPAVRPAGSPGYGSRRSWRRAIGFQNIGAVYVLLAVIVVFSLWVPETFATWDTAKVVLNQNSITGLVALALVIPLASGVFDLSVGQIMGVCAVFSAWLLVHAQVSMTAAIVLTLLCALGLGVLNGIVVVKFRIDSFIGTLATGSLMQALIFIVSDNTSVTGPQLTGSFGEVARANVAGVTLPVLYVLVIALVIWYLLEHTATGRSLYAVGYARETARLTGIRTERLRFMSLVVSATIAGFAGIVIAASVSAGSPTVGPPYLLPAFAAAFVGATQFKAGRFNSWGTVLAVVLLGTGIVGLSLAGVPLWAPDVFVGVALILALGLTGFERRART